MIYVVGERFDKIVEILDKEIGVLGDGLSYYLVCEY